MKVPGRNYEKTVYWVIPVDRDSFLFKDITEDAHELSMSGSIPKLILIRLAQFYEQRRNNQRSHPGDAETGRPTS
jgi:hypothetical protein